jgi:tRNA nucleotidyltransferase (CCA-adding enzyme)
MVQHLPGERVGEEWKKLLLKAERPSVGLRAGMETGIYAALHPELALLPDTPQDPEWHPEGTHTWMVVDAAADLLRRERLDSSEAWVLMLAALCHDLGEPASTKIEADGRITSRKHEEAGKNPRALSSLA